MTAFYGMALVPSASDEERRALAARFRLTPVTIPDLPGTSARIVRDVHPALRHLQAWASSTGASAALNDLDGDGAPNDMCLVDPRSDAVVIAPVPGTGDRYAPFVIQPPTAAPGVAPTGCAPGDLNEDGLADVLVHYWGRTPLAFLRRTGSPMTPAGYLPVDVWPGGEVWNTNTVTIADLDGDGHQDLVVGNFFGDGVRPLDPQDAAPVRMPSSMSRAKEGGRNRLLRWIGASSGSTPSVRFADVSGALSEDVLGGWTHAVSAADLDGDGLVELYFANDFGTDRLLHNRSRVGHVAFAELRGRRAWSTPLSKTLGRDSFKGMGVDFGDVNGDGVPDIYVSNLAIPGIAVENHFMFVSEGRLDAMQAGVAPYEDRSEPLGLSRSGWAWDCKLADFDNDGTLEAIQAVGFIRGAVTRWPELHELLMVNDGILPRPGVWLRLSPGDDISGHERDAFFVRDGRGHFVDVAREVGLDPDGTSPVTRGIAIADVDRDGDLDFVLAKQWGPFVFYRNDSAPRPFLGVRAVVGGDEGAQTEFGGPLRAAVGASVVVTLPDGRRRVTQIDGGGGHTGRRSQEAHIGLGAVDRDTELPVEIVWRDAAGPHRDRVTLRPGWHTVRLGSAVPRVQP